MDESSLIDVQRAIDRYNANEEKIERTEQRLRRLYAERDRLREICFKRLPAEGVGISMGDRFELSIFWD